MIFARRITLEGSLTLHSDLHIGGSDGAIDADGRQFSPTMRNASGVPIIPASSLKGVLRAALLETDKDLAELLFGKGSKHEEGQGHAARLWLDHAVLTTAADNLDNLSANPVENGVFRARHVALDPATGAAEDHKLFSREMVGAGATFTFRADWFGQDVNKLAAPLALLRDGVQLGRGGTKGHGLVMLDMTTLRLKEHVPQKDGTLLEKPLDVTPLYEAVKNSVPTRPNRKQITLTLTCEGPFLSVRETGGHNKKNEMQPLERGDRPVLWPESLAGALRNRARWLAALAAEDGDHKDRPSTRRSREELADDRLSAVECLFGVTGRKGKLVVKEVECTVPGNRVGFTNNSIDRFTGAILAGALYGKNAFWQPCFTAELEVTGEHDLLDTLLADLKTEGLELGHGSSTGFGWFKVEEADDGT